MESQATLISPSAHVYERLSDIGSPTIESQRAVYNSLPLGDDSDDDDTGANYYTNRRRAPTNWLERIIGQRSPPPVQSNYLTLIPLSDDRLKPRHTALLVSCLLLLAVALAAGVFIAVPRGVTVGSIQVRSSRMSFNTSKSTYQIILTATIPIFNPNYLPVEVGGSLVVSFYDQQAGTTGLDTVSIPARAFPEVIDVEMDASSVPAEYLFTIYTQCFTFPERIIFFLTGKLTSRFLGWTFPIPDIDNYFIISCANAPDRRPDPPHIPGRPTKPPRPPRAPPRPPRYVLEGKEGRVAAGVARAADGVDSGEEVDWEEAAEVLVVVGSGLPRSEGGGEAGGGGRGELDGDAQA